MGRSLSLSFFWSLSPFSVLLIPGLHPGYETDPILLIKICKRVCFEEMVAFEYRILDDPTSL